MTNGEAAISITAGTLAYIDDFLPEDDALIAARRNAAEVGGAAPVSPLTGGALRFMAAAIGARSVVEIGTGCGTSGIWLLRGMRPGAVLTTVDVEPEHQRLARAAFLAAGFPSSRYRLIGGLALEVLPRLADGAYDMVFCDADRQEFADYLTAALRLLRPGGIVVFNDALPGITTAERLPTTPRRPRPASCASRCGPTSASCRCCCPIGNGLLAAVKRARLAGWRQPGAAAGGCRTRSRPWTARRRPRPTGPGPAMSRCAHGTPAGELAQEERRDDRAGRLVVSGDVREVSDRRVQRGPVVILQRHPPQPVAAGLTGRDQRGRQRRRRWRTGRRAVAPSATRAAPVSVARSTIWSGASSAAA